MTFIEFLRKTFSDDNGNPSMIRMLSAIGFLQWSIVITVGFIWVLRWYPYLVLGYLITLSALVGGIIGLKVVQKKLEKPVIQADTTPSEENAA